ILGEWTLGLCFALLLLAVLCGVPRLRRLLSLGPLRFIGIISYSLYVWHIPLMMVLYTDILASSPAAYPRFLLLVVLVLVLWCFASYFLVERPFLRWRRAAH